MNLTVSDILALPNFKDMTVLAGSKGLNRPVGTVSVLDNLDGTLFLNGGEMVLSTGYIWKTDIDLMAKFIDEANFLNCAALVIKVGRYVEHIPDRILAKAEALNFPIISFPMTMSFSDIISTIIMTLTKKETEVWALSSSVYHSLGELALRTRDTQEIVNAFAVIIRSDCFFLDCVFNKRYFASKSPKFSSDCADLKVEELMALYAYERISFDSNVYGYLFINRPLADLKEDMIIANALTQAGTILNFDIQKKLSNQEIERKHKNEFVLDLLLGNFASDDEIEEKAALYGFNADLGVVVLVIKFSRDHDVSELDSLLPLQTGIKRIQEKLIPLMEYNINKIFQDWCYVRTGQAITMLLFTSEDNYTESRHSLISCSSSVCENEAISPPGYRFSIGIGGYKSNLSSVHSSYQEANASIQIAALWHGGSRKCACWDNLGAYKIFDSLLSSKEFSELCQHYFDNLEKYDLNRKSDLMKTLIVLDKNNWSISQAAKSLFVHYNTIKYRVNKISEILEADFEDNNQKLIISLCLKLLEIKKSDLSELGHIK